MKPQITVHTGGVLYGLIGGAQKLKFGFLGETVSIATYLKHLCLGDDMSPKIGVILQCATIILMRVCEP